MKKKTIFILFLILPLVSFAQYNQYQKKDTAQAPYPYSFPIFGNFLYDIGIDLPYPAGIMVNSFYGIQHVLITEIAIGFEDGIGPGRPGTTSDGYYALNRV
jgi:hypothetical protein